MKIIRIKLHSWETPSLYNLGKNDLKLGDQVVVKTDFGLEIGQVMALEEIEDSAFPEPLQEIIRVATQDDLSKLAEKSGEKEKAQAACQQIIDQYKLEMKIVDCIFSLDGSKVTFAFTSPGRVDFRNLVKDLTHHFQKSIRLQQIGSRDEARVLGRVGSCGRELCCQKFLKNLGNVSADLAKLQQLSHRGSERLSGACGRLKCCLVFEEQLYKQNDKSVPALYSIIKTDKVKGKVVNRNLLKKTVLIETEDNRVVEVEVDEIRGQN